MKSNVKPHGAKQTGGRGLSNQKAANELLCKSVEADDIEGVKRALEDGADPNNLNNPYEEEGEIIPLNDAIDNENIECITLLLSSGADLEREAEAYELKTALGCVISNTQPDNISDNKLAIIRTLLEHGADIHAHDYNGTQPLFEAIELGLTSIVQLMIDNARKLNINERNYYDSTPLNTAAYHKKWDIMEILLEVPGIDVTTKDDDGNTAIYYVATGAIVLTDKLQESDIQLAKVSLLQRLLQLAGEQYQCEKELEFHLGFNSFLWEFQEKLQLFDNKVRQAYIHTLINHEQTNIEYRFKPGDIVITPNTMHNSEWDDYIVIDEYDERLREMYVKFRHSYMQTKYEKGMTLLHSVAQLGYADCIELLIKRGVHVNADDDIDETPLHKAARNGHLDAVKKLVSNELIHINKRNRSAKTPLHIAVQAGHVHICEYLIAQDQTEINYQDIYGKTALQFALKSITPNGNRIRDLLLEHPAIDKNLEDLWGKSPLTIMHKDTYENKLEKSKKKMFLASKDNRVNYNVQDRYGKTWLHYLVNRSKPGRHEQEFRALMDDHTVDVNKKDYRGNTPLHLACKRAQPHYIVNLSKKGADWTIKNNIGQTPSDILHLEISNREYSDRILCCFIWLCQYNEKQPEQVLQKRKSIKQSRTSDSAAKKNKMPPKIESDWTHGKGVSVKLAECEKLHNAIQNGDVKGVTQALKSGADPNIAINTHLHAETNYSHLCAAISNKSIDENVKLEIVTALLEKGAKIQGIDRHEKKPLQLAIKMGLVDIVKQLLRVKGLDLNALNLSGETPLMVAAKHKQREIVQLLVNRPGVDPNKKKYLDLTKTKYTTALDYIARAGFADILEQLSKKYKKLIFSPTLIEKLLLEFINFDKSTPQKETMVSEQVKYLLLSLNLKNSNLRVYVPLKRFEDMLTEETKKAEFFLTDDKVESCALSSRTKEFIRQRFGKGTTVLHRATEHGFVTSMELLLKRGANINDIDDNGNTPLHRAITNGHIEAVKILLLNSNLNLNEKNLAGETPLHKAVQFEHPDICQLLLDQKSIKPNIQDIAGKTALHYAMKKNTADSRGIVQLLLSKENINTSVEDNRGESYDNRNRKKSDQVYMKEINKLFMAQKDKKLKSENLVNFKVGNGKNQLHYFVRDLKHKDKFHALLVDGVYVNVQDHLGNTPLHKACKYLHPYYVYHLLTHGADPTLKNKFGHTPLDIAKIELSRSGLISHALSCIMLLDKKIEQIDNQAKLAKKQEKAKRREKRLLENKIKQAQSASQLLAKQKETEQRRREQQEQLEQQRQEKQKQLAQQQRQKQLAIQQEKQRTELAISELSDICTRLANFLKSSGIEKRGPHCLGIPIEINQHNDTFIIDLKFKFEQAHYRFDLYNKHGDFYANTTRINKKTLIKFFKFSNVKNLHCVVKNNSVTIHLDRNIAEKMINAHDNIIKRLYKLSDLPSIALSASTSKKHKAAPADSKKEQAMESSSLTTNPGSPSSTESLSESSDESSSDSDTPSSVAKKESAGEASESSSSSSIQAPNTYVRYMKKEIVESPLFSKKKKRNDKSETVTFSDYVKKGNERNKADLIKHYLSHLHEQMQHLELVTRSTSENIDVSPLHIALLRVANALLLTQKLTRILKVQSIVDEQLVSILRSRLSSAAANMDSGMLQYIARELLNYSKNIRIMFDNGLSAKAFIRLPDTLTNVIKALPDSMEPQHAMESAQALNKLIQTKHAKLYQHMDDTDAMKFQDYQIYYQLIKHMLILGEFYRQYHNECKLPAIFKELKNFRNRFAHDIDANTRVNAISFTITGPMLNKLCRKLKALEKDFHEVLINAIKNASSQARACCP